MGKEFFINCINEYKKLIFVTDIFNRCEVTADDFETASLSKYSEVVGKSSFKLNLIISYYLAFKINLYFTTHFRSMF